MSADLVSLLTPREREVLKLIAQGMRNKQIGEKLDISEQTVETHRKHIKRKLQAKHTTDLVKMAEYLD